jgi:class III cytochrome C family protein/doubled CXXCH motif protein
MRVRTAKERAQRIDLNYFKHPHGLKRWRILLSLALPVVALLWVSVYAVAGSRKPYSAGPVSSAHAFAEMKCEVCHTGFSETRDPAATSAPSLFRAHSTDAACLTCHDAPAHAANQTTPQPCATCHQDHRGRVQLAKIDDGFCVECHGDLRTTHGDPKVAMRVGPFPSGHPEFAAVKPGATDPGRLRFNHAVHLKDTIRGPKGAEKLECASCHTPEAGRRGAKARGPAATGLMAPIAYDPNCARCHPLFFDERVEQAAPHAKPENVRAFVQQALVGYIREHPRDISTPDSAFRRVPLNFPRPPEPPARNAQEWVQRRAAADERLLWNKTCAECHERDARASDKPASGGLPSYAPTNVTKQWMPRAAFDHTPHLMVTCSSCHAADASTKTSDVLLPNQAVCATCHASSNGALRLGSGQAESRCFECHQYHDWTKSHPVTPSYSLTDFK